MKRFEEKWRCFDPPLSSCLRIAKCSDLMSLYILHRVFITKLEFFIYHSKYVFIGNSRILPFQIMDFFFEFYFHFSFSILKSEENWIETRKFCLTLQNNFIYKIQKVLLGPFFDKVINFVRIRKKSRYKLKFMYRKCFIAQRKVIILDKFFGFDRLKFNVLIPEEKRNDGLLLKIFVSFFWKLWD